LLKSRLASRISAANNTEVNVLNDDNNAHPDRILRIREVLALTGLSASTLWREIEAGRFPPPVAISARGKGWLASDAYAWLKNRRHAS
jgi:prophage regulatory protein